MTHPFESNRRIFVQSLGLSAVSIAANGLARAGTVSALAPEFSPNVILPRRLAKHLIILNLSGGPSHIDTFDPKPDAESDFRNFDPVAQTTIPGIFLSSNLPRLAARTHLFSLIRSIHHTGPATHAAAVAWHQGLSEPTQRPYFSENVSDTEHITLGLQSLRCVHLGQRPNVKTSDSRSLDDVGSISAKTHSPGTWRTQRRSFASLKWNDANRHFDYGSHALGRACLQARQFVEDGAQVVTINQFATVYDQITWDMHANSSRLRTTHEDYRNRLCPQLDQALSALLDDLQTRGLLDETVIVALGEMGRTPKINAYGGRDHHTGAWSGLIAGGPIRSGQVVGATDEIGEFPVARPVTLEEISATLAWSTGFDKAQLSDKAAGINDQPGTTSPQPIHELI